MRVSSKWPCLEISPWTFPYSSKNQSQNPPVAGSEDFGFFIGSQAIIHYDTEVMQCGQEHISCLARALLVISDTGAPSAKETSYLLT